MFKKIKVNKWEEALSLGGKLHGWCFRGQSNADWKLKPQIERFTDWIPNSISGASSYYEHYILTEFKRSAHNFLSALPEDDKYIEWLSLMQHHGAPTRLLDVTKSFPVAAFFAIEEAETDCAIWAFNTKQFRKHLKNRTNFNEDKLNPYTDPYVDFAEKTIRGTVGDHCFIMPITPYKQNQRLWIQQGLFLFPCDLNYSFERNLLDTFNYDKSAFSIESEEFTEKFLIQDFLNEIEVLEIIAPRKIHYYARRQLWEMNINAATLFPGIDGFARSLGFHVALLKDLQLLVEAKKDTAKT